MADDELTVLISEGFPEMMLLLAFDVFADCILLRDAVRKGGVPFAPAFEQWKIRIAGKPLGRASLQ